MKPDPKAPGIERFLEGLSQAAFKRSRLEAIIGGTCVECGEEVTNFKDGKSRQEYDLTGMCQECQDKFYEELKELEQ